MVQNPGFELDGANWNIGNTFSISTADKYEGSKSLRLVGTGGWTITWQGNIAVTPNTWYTYSAYVKGSARILMKVFNSGWTGIGETFAEPSSNWTKYTVSFYSGSNSQVIVSLMDAASGTSYIDNVELSIDMTTSARFITLNESENESAKFDKLQVYPNPASGLVNIVLPNEVYNVEVSVIDINGKTVRSQMTDSNIVQFNLHGLITGVYFVRVITNETNLIKRLIIE